MQPMDTCPTIKVKPWGNGQGDFVEINEADFDPKVHKPFDEQPKRAAKAKAGDE